jgi:hypothetical protein
VTALAHRTSPLLSPPLAPFPLLSPPLAPLGNLLLGPPLGNQPQCQGNPAECGLVAEICGDVIGSIALQTPVNIPWAMMRFTFATLSKDDLLPSVQIQI